LPKVVDLSRKYTSHRVVTVCYRHKLVKNITFHARRTATTRLLNTENTAVIDPSVYSPAAE